uniref:Myb-like domain-containing protein n=1 Tax=Tanacetum cinerariifolium TaxID=118510 RepID=A0A6L2JXT7_TANCI|nr:hypothetical protein [Tanacetum cinerariifolium]
MERFSSFNLLDLDEDDFEPLFTQPSKGPSQSVEEDSHIEEVAPVKRKYVRRRQPAKKNDKDVNEPWTPEEEVALRKAWVDISKNNKEGNGKNTNGFWIEITTYFQKETWSAKRSYDFATANGKIGFVLSPRRIDYGIVMLVLETRGIPLRFGEV